MHDTELERSACKQLKRLLKTYDLSKWTYTDLDLIDSSTIPHSHPVLTLNTRWAGNENQILASLLHEQIHWLLSSRLDKVDAAIRDLRTFYPTVSKSPPDGARDEKSTYLHLVVHYLEYQALTELLGATTATMVLEERQQAFYKWIYGKVLTDTKQIGDTVRRHGLEV